MSLWLFLSMAVCAAGAALGAPTLKLRLVGNPQPVNTGDIVTISVGMSDLGGEAAAGFQAFLAFDSSKLSLQQGHYTAVPFGLPVVHPIVASGNEIDLASGINVFSGQTPTSADATLAILHFEVLQPMCQVTQLQFRSHDPPSRLTDELGNDITPLVLSGLPIPEPCLGDVVPNGAVNVNDLLLVINRWGACPINTACCADITGDGTVGVNDLLVVINNWGPCP